MASTSINTLPEARARLGLNPSSSRFLPGWGLRASGGPGWYVRFVPQRSPSVVHVEPSVGARLDHKTLHHVTVFTGPPTPCVSSEELDERSIALLTAVPRADGLLLARAFVGTCQALLRADVAGADDGPPGDPLFLFCAFLGREATASDDRWFGAAAAAQRVHEATMSVAADLVAAPGGWSGGVPEVAERASMLLLARDLVEAPEAAAEALASAATRRPLGARPPARPRAHVDAAGDLTALVWEAWRSGWAPNAAEGAAMLRRARPSWSEDRAVQRLTTLLVTLELGLASLEPAVVGRR